MVTPHPTTHPSNKAGAGPNQPQGLGGTALPGALGLMGVQPALRGG